MAENQKEDPPTSDVQTIDLDVIEGSTDIVRVNGQPFDMRATDSLGLAPRGRLQRLLRRIEALEAIDDEQVTEADEAEYRARLLEVASIVIPTAPKELVEKIGTGGLADLATVFFVKAAMKSPRLAMMARLTSQISSPKSSTSTGETP